MFKRLMIGLFALSLVVIWLSEANAYVYRRRSVLGTVSGGDPNNTFFLDIIGLPADEYGNGCGQLVGDLYCLEANADDTACDSATRYTSTLVLVADGDLVKPNVRPYYFTPEEANSDLADFGVRDQIRVMERLSTETDPDPTHYPHTFVIELDVGRTANKAALLGFKQETINYWRANAGNSSDTDSVTLQRFVGTGPPPLTVDCGFGISCDGDSTDQWLLNIPGGLEAIVGDDLDKLVDQHQQACIVVSFDQLKSGDDVHSKFRGIMAVQFLSRTNSKLTMELLDSDDACTSTLYWDWRNPPTGTAPTGCRTVEDVVVFAPDAPASTDCVATGDVPFVQQPYPGVIACPENSSVCKGTVEVELDPDYVVSEELCPTGTTFKRFILKNRPGTGYAFIAVVQSDDNPALNEQVVCGEGIPGIPNVEFSRYGCVPLGSPGTPAEVSDCCQCTAYEQAP